MEELNLDEIKKERFLEKYLWGLNKVLQMNCRQQVLVNTFLQDFPDIVVDSFYEAVLPDIILGKDKESRGVAFDKCGSRYVILLDNEDKLWYQVRCGESAKALCIYPNNKRTGNLFYFDDGNKLLMFSGTAKGKDVYINCDTYEKERNKE